jgi:uncharacterized protein (DUF362 family)/NAD-dependent dihydropyrimidine dehydrogenase PreA subunit
MAVAIVRTQDPKDVSRLLTLLGGLDRFVKKGDRVLIKPNVCAPRSSQSGAVTDPELTVSLCRLVADCGGRPFVAESPIYPFPAKAAFRMGGYSDFSKKYGFPIVDVDSDKEVTIRIPQGAVLREEVVSKRALEADVIINVPVMKNHVHTTVTLGLKNAKGLIPRRNKHIIHLKGLDEGIVDLNTVIRSTLVVVDAIVGMEGMLSPLNGRPKRMDLIVAGDNVVETDAVCCRIMGLDPLSVRHVYLAEKRGLGNTGGIEILGEAIETVRSPFRFYDRPRSLTSLGGRIAWSAWNWGYNQIAKQFGADILAPRVEKGEWAWDKDRCNQCKMCIEGCPVHVLSLEEDRIIRDQKGCIYCYCCAEVCPQGAISKTL